MDLVIEIFGVITGLLYLFFEIKHSRAMWFLGLAMAVVYIYIFAAEGLYASMSFQCYYFIMSIYGIIQWKKDSGVFIRRPELPRMAVSSLLSVGIFFLIYYVLGDYTDDSQPVLDAIVTSLSILATYWLSRSYIWQWWIWFAVNIISIAMYIRSGLYPTAALYSVYTVSAVYGFYYWRKNGVVLK